MSRSIRIAGGGLAGLSLGIALRQRGVEVELHEAGNYPRHRVCGEFICGVTPATLGKLGIGDSLAAARLLTSTAWFHQGSLLLAAPLRAPAWGISRFELDEQLRQRFEQVGGRLYVNSRLKNESAPGQVWTAGRQPERGVWLGLKCHFRGLELDHDLEMHLGRSGYVGLSRIENHTVNLCGLVRIQSELAGRGSERLFTYLVANGLSALAEKLRAARLIESSFLGIAGFQLGHQRAAASSLVLGDAYAMIPPFTGNGMSMAFESAAWAVDPLHDYALERIDWNEATRRIRSLLSQKFSRRLQLAQVLHPFLTSPSFQKWTVFIARSGLLPYQSCFHALR